MSKMLNRKTNRKIKAKMSLEKEFDLPRFKDQMAKEMSRFKNKKTVLNISIDNDYEKSYKLYLSEGFTYSIQMIISRMFSDSKTLPKELRNEYPLHNLMSKIASQLMMNELEIVYFSIYLDTFGWMNENFDIIEHFLITALSVKKYLNLNTKFIENFLSAEYPNILEKFNKWLKMQKDNHLLITISPREVNARFNLLKRPFNAYCKNNFIDYNESVDRILQMSLPYGDGVKTQKIVNQAKEGSESKPRKRKKTKEKASKEKEEKNLLRVKKDKPSFNVMKPQDSQDEQERMKDLLNLKDDSMNSLNNTDHPSQTKGDKIKMNNSFANHKDNNDFALNRNDKSITDNDEEKGDLNQSGYSEFHDLHRGFSNQPSANLLLNQNSNLNFSSLPYPPNFSNYGLDFIKQSSDFNFNGDQLFFGRNTSGIDQVFFRRSSTQNFEGQEELNDAIFKPIDSKQHISFGSLPNDYKIDSALLNKNLSKPAKEDKYPPPQLLRQYEPPKDTYANAMSSFNFANTLNTINNLSTPLNTNNPLIQNNAPAKKNFLLAFQDLKNSKQ